MGRQIVNKQSFEPGPPIPRETARPESPPRPVYLKGDPSAHRFPRELGTLYVYEMDPVEEQDQGPPRPPGLSHLDSPHLVTKADDERESLQRMVSRLQGEIASTRSDYREKERHVRELETKVEGLQGLYYSAATQGAQHEVENRRLANQLSQERNARQAATSDLAERDRQIVTLQAELATRAKEAKTAVAEAARLNAALEAERLQGAEQQAAHRQLADRLLQERTAAQSDLAERDQQIATLHAELAGKRQEIATLQAELATRAKEAKTAVAEAARLDAALRVERQEGAQHEAAHRRLASQLLQERTAAQSDVAERAQEVDALHAELAGKRQEGIALEAELATRSQEAKTAVAEAARLDAALRAERQEAIRAADHAVDTEVLFIDELEKSHKLLEKQHHELRATRSRAKEAEAMLSHLGDRLELAETDAQSARQEAAAANHAEAAARETLAELHRPDSGLAPESWLQIWTGAVSRFAESCMQASTRVAQSCLQTCNLSELVGSHNWVDHAHDVLLGAILGVKVSR